MGAAAGGVDRVGEGVDRLVVGGRLPLHRDLDAHRVGRLVVGLGLEGDDAGDRGLALVEVVDVVGQTALVVEGLLEHPVAVAGAVQLVGAVGVGLDGAVLDGLGDRGRLRPLVAQLDPQPLVEERGLAEVARDRLEVVVGRLEDVGGGVPRDRGAGALTLLELADLAQVVVGYAAGELLLPQVAPVLDLHVEVGRERVHHGGADTVQTTGDLVAATTELTAGVQHGQRQRRGGDLLAGRGVGRDASAVVGDAHPAVLAQRHLDRVAVARERLVDRVVHDLPDQVVQAAGPGRPDVHTRSFADRFESFEDLDGRRVVCDSVCGLVVRHGSRLVGSGHRCDPPVISVRIRTWCRSGMQRADQRRGSET